MDSNKYKIKRIFFILMLSIYLRIVTPTNIDCDGKPFHCANATHFMICVDLGAGVSKTVDNFVIQCPPPTVCHRNSNFECEYHLPPATTQSTIRSGDETNDFEPDTQITTFSDDITNTMSPIQKTSKTRFINENYYTSDVTTHTNYVPDMQTYKENEISGIIDIFTIDQSNFLPNTTETYETEHLPLRSTETHSHSSSNNSMKLVIPIKEKNIVEHDPILSVFTKSEQESNITSDIRNITNISSSTESNNIFSFIKSSNTSHDIIRETARKDVSTLMDEEVNTKEILNKYNASGEINIHATKSSGMVTKPLVLNFATPQTTLFSIKDNIYFEHTSPRTDNKKTEPKLNSADNISEIRLQQETRNFNFNGTLSRTENKVELISEHSVIEQVTQKLEINTSYPIYELNISDITEKDNLTKLSSTSEPILTPTELVVDTMPTIKSTTPSTYNPSDNESVLFKHVNKHNQSPNNPSNPITEYQVPVTLSSKSIFNETIDESSTPTPNGNLNEKNIQEMIDKSILRSSHLNEIITLLPVDDLYEATSTTIIDNSKYDHTFTSIKQWTTTVQLHSVQQIPQTTNAVGKVNISSSDDQDMSQLKFKEDILTTDANIPNLLVYNISYLENDDFRSSLTTLDSEDAMKSTTVSSDNINDKNILQDDNANQISPEVEATSTVLDSISFSHYDIETDKISIMENYTISDYGNDYFTYESMTMTPEWNAVEVTESFPTFTSTIEDQKLSLQQESTMNLSKITENTYFNDTILNITNSTTNIVLNLKEVIPDENIIITFSPYNVSNEIYPTYPTNSPTTNANTRNLSINADFLLTSKNYSNFFSTLSTLERAAIEQVTDKNEITENSTLLYSTRNENEKYLLQYENEKEIIPDVAGNSTSFNLTLLQHIFGTEKSAINETTTTFDYNTSTSKVDVQPTIEKVNYNNIFEKPLTTNLSFVKDNNYNKSQNNAEGIIADLDHYFSPNINLNVDSNMLFNNSKFIDPEIVTMATLSNISEFETLKDRLLNEQPPSDWSINKTSLLQEPQNATRDWTDVNSTNTENSLISKNHTLEKHLVPQNLERKYGNMLEISKNITKSSSNANDYKMPVKLQPNELELHVGIDSLIRENTSKNYNTTEETYYMDQITTVPNRNGIILSKYEVEVTVDNRQALNESTRLTTQHQVTTETFLKEENYYLNTEILVTNDIIMPTASKPLMSPLLSKVDERTATINESTIGVSTNNYFNLLSTDKPSNVVVHTENIRIKNNFTYTNNNDQNNKGKELPGYTNDAVITINMEVPGLKIQDKLRSTEMEKNITIAKATVPNNIIDKNGLEKTGKLFLSSNKSLKTLENIKPKKDVIITIKKFDTNVTDNPFKEQNLNLIGVDIANSTYSGIKVVGPTNGTNYFVNKQSKFGWFNFPPQYHYNNNSIKSNYTVNDRDKVTAAPMSEISITIENNGIPNNLDTTNNPFNKSNENRFSNKRSILVNTETPLYDMSFKTEKSNTVSIERILIDNKAKTSPISEVDLEATTSNTGVIKLNSQIVINGTNDLYMRKNKVKNILNVGNSNGTTFTNLSSGPTPTRYLGSVTTEPYRPLTSVFFENFKDASLYSKLSPTIQKADPLLISSYESNKTKAVNSTKKYIPMLPTASSVVNKTIVATTNLATESRNNINATKKSSEGSTSTALFTCKNRFRGRFADKYNCRKYYICFSKIQPIVGECPNNTVFSEIKKQCTKNLSHCIRNNQFRCIQEGRFSDVLRRNIYYICVNYNSSYIRFQFQCQKGYHLNKTSVRCVSDIKFQSLISSISTDSVSSSNKQSDQSSIKRKSKKQAKEDTKHVCKQEGKFPDAKDCRRYYVCSKNSKSVFRRRTKMCDSDEVFHHEKKKCVDRDSYECN